MYGDFLLIEYPFECIVTEAEGLVRDSVEHEVIDHAEGVIDHSSVRAGNEEHGKRGPILDHVFKGQWAFFLAGVTFHILGSATDDGNGNCHEGADLTKSYIDVHAGPVFCPIPYQLTFLSKSTVVKSTGKGVCEAVRFFTLWILDVHFGAEGSRWITGARGTQWMGNPMITTALGE